MPARFDFPLKGGVLLPLAVHRLARCRLVQQGDRVRPFGDARGHHAGAGIQADAREHGRDDDRRRQQRPIPGWPHGTRNGGGQGATPEGGQGGHSGRDGHRHGRRRRRRGVRVGANPRRGTGGDLLLGPGAIRGEAPAGQHRHTAHREQPLAAGERQGAAQQRSGFRVGQQGGELPQDVPELLFRQGAAVGGQGGERFSVARGIGVPGHAAGVAWAWPRHHGLGEQRSRGWAEAGLQQLAQAGVRPEHGSPTQLQQVQAIQRRFDDETWSHALS